jgi:hypothetical protein
LTCPLLVDGTMIGVVTAASNQASMPSRTLVGEPAVGHQAGQAGEVSRRDRRSIAAISSP